VVTAHSLSPGEAGSLEVTFDTTKRQGEQEKTVRVFTNDPDNELVVLSIAAQIITPVSVEPSVARIGDLGPDEERSVKLKLLLEDPATVSIRRIKTNSSQVTASLLEPPDDGEGLLEIRMTGEGRPYGKFEEKITIVSTSDELPRLEVPVVGQVVGDIRLEPPAIGLQGNTSPIEVRLSSAANRPFQVTGLEDPSGFLDAGLEQAPGGQGYTISVSIKPGAAGSIPPDYRGALRISTDREDQPSMILPVHLAGPGGRPRGGRTKTLNQNQS
jgi:hypothetical protein